MRDGIRSIRRAVLACAVAGSVSVGLAAEPREGTRFNAELEVGPVWQTRNDVQVPNDETGTRFSIVDLVGSGPSPFGRFYFTWNISGRHGLRVLLAPLRIEGDGIPTEPIAFEGETFAAGVPTDATYQFSSWRVGYRYRFHDGERWRWWVGFTAKVRDALIRLEQPGRSAEKTDLGFVPLAYIGGTWRFAERWQFVFDLEALGGGPGRAEDLALLVRYDIGDRWTVGGGYRTVEGGADVDEVYNFAWLNYVVVSASYSF